MNIDFITLRNLIRLEVGNVGVDDLPDQVIESKMQMASSSIAAATSGGVGGMGGGAGSGGTSLGTLDFIQCVAGQQKYPLPPGRDIQEVFWSGATENQINVGLVSSMADSPAERRPKGGMALYYRSDVLMMEMRRNQLDLPYMTDILDGYVYVEPTPVSDDQKIYYLYTESGSTIMPGDLDSKFERALLLGACADIFRYLSNRFRTRQIPLRTGNLQQHDKTVEYAQMAEAYDALFDDEILRVSV